MKKFSTPAKPIPKRASRIQKAFDAAGMVYLKSQDGTNTILAHKS